MRVLRIIAVSALLVVIVVQLLVALAVNNNVVTWKRCAEYQEIYACAQRRKVEHYKSETENLRTEQTRMYQVMANCKKWIQQHDYQNEVDYRALGFTDYDERIMCEMKKGGNTNG